MKYNRRQLLATVSLLPLAACGNVTNETLLTDVRLVIESLIQLEPLVISYAPSIYDKFVLYVNTAKEIADKITLSPTATTIQNLVSAVEQALGLLTSVGTLPIEVTSIVAAIRILLPIILAAVGVMTPQAAYGNSDAARARLQSFTRR